MTPLVVCCTDGMEVAPLVAILGVRGALLSPLAAGTFRPGMWTCLAGLLLADIAAPGRLFKGRVGRDGAAFLSRTCSGVRDVVVAPADDDRAMMGDFVADVLKRVVGEG